MNVTITMNSEFNTQESCMQSCFAKGLSYAGVEFSVACFCSATVPAKSAAMACPKKMMPCASNSSETCGASSILDAFSFTCREPEPVPARKAEAQACVGNFTALVDASRKLLNALLGTVSTTGAIGSVENLMQHSFSAMLTAPRLVLEAALGEQLPAAAVPRFEYTGAER